MCQVGVAGMKLCQLWKALRYITRDRSVGTKGDASEWEKVFTRVVMRAAFRDVRGHTLGSFKSIHPPMLSQVNILLINVDKIFPLIFFNHIRSIFEAKQSTTEIVISIHLGTS